VVFDVWPADYQLSGTIYVDGSALQAALGPNQTRAGWAAVTLDRMGAVRACILGPVDGQQESGVAEITAATQALRHCRPPVTIVTDYEPLIQGIKAGAETCRARKKYGAAWKKFWAALEDVGLGEGGARFRWVPSHRKERFFPHGSDDWFDVRGNGTADTKAKKAARLHPQDDGIIERAQQLYGAMRALLCWIGEAAAIVAAGPRDVIGPQPGRGPNRARDSAGEQARSAATRRKHEPALLQVAGSKVERWICLHCGVSAASAIGKQSPLRKTGCSGAPAAIRKAHKSHSLWLMRPFVFCARCGAHAVARACKLAGECRGHPANATAEQRKARLLEGKHPISGKVVGTPVALEEARRGVITTIGVPGVRFDEDAVGFLGVGGSSGVADPRPEQPVESHDAAGQGGADKQEEQPAAAGARRRIRGKQPPPPPRAQCPRAVGAEKADLVVVL